MHKNKCPLQEALKMLGGKWKLVIIWHLGTGTKRFNLLKKEIDKVSTKVLSEQLQSLIADKLVKRKTLHTNPPQVEYSLTEKGKTVIPVVEQIYSWYQLNQLS